MVHIGLEGGGRVAKAEEHHCGFVKPKRGRKGGFLVILRSDENVVISPVDIEFSEDFAIFEFVYKVRYERERIGIFDGM